MDSPSALAVAAAVVAVAAVRWRPRTARLTLMRVGSAGSGRRRRWASVGVSRAFVGSCWTSMLTRRSGVSFVASAVGDGRGVACEGLHL